MTQLQRLIRVLSLLILLALFVLSFVKGVTEQVATVWVEFIVIWVTQKVVWDVIELYEKSG